MVADRNLTLSLDALVRSLALRRSELHGLFLGAGASITSGIQSAENCIWEWKRQIFITKNVGLEPQFRDTSLPSVRERSTTTSASSVCSSRA